MSTIRAKIYRSSYSGCEGWSHWLIGEIRFKCKDTRLGKAKSRLLKRLQKNEGTYERVSIEWSK